MSVKQKLGRPEKKFDWKLIQQDIDKGEWYEEIHARYGLTPWTWKKAIKEERIKVDPEDKRYTPPGVDFRKYKHVDRELLEQVPRRVAELLSPAAWNTIMDILNNDDESVSYQRMKLDAAKYLLDRAYGKADQKIDIDATVSTAHYNVLLELAQKHSEEIQTAIDITEEEERNMLMQQLKDDE